MRHAKGLSGGGVALALLVLGASLTFAVLAIRRSRSEGGGRCVAGTVARGANCELVDCNKPLIRTARGCEAPNVRVRIPATHLVIGPSDWEAQGRVAARTVDVAPFELDAFELTVGAVDSSAKSELTRPLTHLGYDDALRLCAARGGRLPTEDEWIAAAAGERGTRYPWGDTGAVCRRAAWGLASGPCAEGASMPDPAGTHADGGDSPLGLHDLAGNVAEWVVRYDDVPGALALGVVRGGSWRTALAADLRTWSRREIQKSAHDDDVGVRCAYP